MAWPHGLTGPSRSAAWRYARAALGASGSVTQHVEQWRALLVATVIERKLASRWAEWVKADRQGEVGVHKLIARLAADGLWLSETLGIYDLSSDERRALSVSIQQLAQES